MHHHRYDGPARISARPYTPQRRTGAPEITTLRLTPIPKGNGRAFVSLRFGHGEDALTIDGFKIVQEPGKRAWVAAPSQERQRVDPHTGEMVTKWYPVVTIPDSWKQAVEAAALAAWERYQKTGELPQDGGGRP